MSLKERLLKKKSGGLSSLREKLLSEKKSEKSPLDLRELLTQIVREEIVKLAEPMTQQVIEIIDTEKLKASVTPKKGKDYIDGRHGKNGIDGKDGKDGKNGRDGRDGKDGIGKDGKDGKDAVYTSEQIVEKVNEAKGVEISSVENLAEELKKIRQRVSRDGIQRGGGMGNVQHEQFALTSGTTSVSLASNVAMSGYGIIGAYVQGQFLARGTHYTNSGGKTVSLLFTPDNNTTMDIVYIRPG